VPILGQPWVIRDGLAFAEFPTPAVAERADYVAPIFRCLPGQIGHPCSPLMLPGATDLIRKTRI